MLLIWASTIRSVKLDGERPFEANRGGRRGRQALLAKHVLWMEQMVRSSIPETEAWLSLPRRSQVRAFQSKWEGQAALRIERLGSWALCIPLPQEDGEYGWICFREAQWAGVCDTSSVTRDPEHLEHL